MSSTISGKQYAEFMIAAQRAAFEALATSQPILNTVGGVPLATIMNQDSTVEAVKQIEKLSVYQEIEYRQKHKDKMKRIDDAIPENLRLRATYTPLIIRELLFWLCNEVARILKLSLVKDAVRFSSKLAEDYSSYVHVWRYEYDDDARKSVVRLMQSWVSSSLGSHIVILKDAYKLVVNNGQGPKYNDPNTRDLISWLFTICALCEEVFLFDTEKINEINKLIRSIGSHIDHKPRDKDFTYATLDYAEGLLNRFGYRRQWSCSMVDMSRKVIRTQLRLYDPQRELESQKQQQKKRWEILQTIMRS